MNFLDPALIHCFGFEKNYFILDIASGSIFQCDKQTYEATCILNSAAGDLTSARQACTPEVREALAELCELAESGELFTLDKCKYTPPPPLVKSLCLNISHDCDLRCAYCFASTGHFGGRRVRMSRKTAHAALDFLIRESGPRQMLEVDFFGGEPLLNTEVMCDAVAYGRQLEKEYNKKIHFTFTTNVVSLNDEITAWAKNNNISVILSHDGRPSIHDSRRIFPDGSGSYHIVSEHIDNHIKNGNGDYYVRGTYCADNLDFVTDIEHWLERGWRKMSMEPVVVKSGKSKLLPEHLPVLQEQYAKLARLYRKYRAQGDPFEFFHFNLELEHAPCLPKRLTGCGAGYEYFVVTPDDELYPCHQFVGRKEFLMGSLKDGILRHDLQEQFRQAYVYNKPKCAACWARFYCSGGCHANAHLINGDIYQPYEMGCELMKIRLECAIALACEKLSESANSNKKQ